MNRTMPIVLESADDLKIRFHREPNPRKRERLQMLYLLASAQAPRRVQLASLLGVSRNTITRWLALYTTGGIPALLDISVPQGKAPALTPDQLDQLRLRLAQPEGFASYGEVQQWIADTLGVSMLYHAVHTLVYDKLRARLKVARPVHEKNEDEITTFKQEFVSRLEAKLPAEQALPVVVWAMDESRVGLHTVRRRRLTARGTKPVGIHQHRFKNFYVYGAIAPQSGKNLFMVAPTMNTQVFQRFVDEFAKQHKETFNVMLLDNSKTHHAKQLILPANVVLLFQPPYAPEVNPAERVWQELKTGLAWNCFETLEALQERVVEMLKGWKDEMLHSLTAYPYIMTALNALFP